MCFVLTFPGSPARISLEREGAMRCWQSDPQPEATPIVDDKLEAEPACSGDEAETTWYNAKNHDPDSNEQSETPELSMSKPAKRQRRRRRLAATRKAESIQYEDFETPTQKKSTTLRARLFERERGILSDPVWDHVNRR